jgi:RNA polymerase sigma factor (sigma-70 family)
MISLDRARTEELLLLEKTPIVVEELLILNSGLIGCQLKKFGLLGDPEAESLGYEALYNSIMTFDTSRSNKFSTYASVCIYNKLGSYVRSLNTSIRKNTISYDEYVDDKGTTHLDRFESPHTADGKLMERVSIENIMKCVDACIDEVTNETQKSILELWRDSEFTATNKEIASKLTCSQSYVSQTLIRFRNNLKCKLEVY